MLSLQENLYANGHLAKSLYFCFLKIGLQLFKALQPLQTHKSRGWTPGGFTTKL